MLAHVLTSWSVRAQNLPEHARNAIHTDAGAQVAGFPRALVAGVTTYAYLTHVPLAAWGEDWLREGTAEVRFRSPVFDGDEVRCEPIEAGSVHALVDGAVRAEVQLGPVTIATGGDETYHGSYLLDGEFGSGYAERAGDALDVCSSLSAVHPAVWPAIANDIVHRYLARGSWVHTRSAIRHGGVVAVGSHADVRATVVRRFASRVGERAVLHVAVEVSGDVVAELEHEAIVALAHHVRERVDEPAQRERLGR
jgi:acyl dehydratase